MSRIVTRSIYGASLQTTLLCGLPYVLVPNTTLNEKFNVQAGVLPQNGAIPRIRYYAIGEGGHRTLAGADGVPYTSPVPHNGHDAALFKHIPFALRRLDDDFTAVERQRYAMRKIENIAGVDYAAYYLRRIDTDGVTPLMELITVQDGNRNSAPFTPTSANLNPTPLDVPAGGAIITSGDMLAVSAFLDMALTAADVEELINVALIKYENELRAVISEVAVVAAVDQIVTGLGASGTSINYTEAMAATVVTFVAAYHVLPYTQDGLDLSVNLGDTEPLLTVTGP